MVKKAWAKAATLHANRPAKHRRSVRMQEGLHQPGREAQFHDLIISGDVDEIPKAEAVAALRRCEWPKRPDHHNCAAMEGSFFYFSYANYAGGLCAHALGCGEHIKHSYRVYACPLHHLQLAPSAGTVL